MKKHAQCCTCAHFSFLVESYYAGECNRADDRWYEQLSAEQRLFVDRVDGPEQAAFYVTSQWCCDDYKDKYQVDQSAQQELL